MGKGGKDGCGTLCPREVGANVTICGGGTAAYPAGGSLGKGGRGGGGILDIGGVGLAVISGGLLTTISDALSPKFVATASMACILAVAAAAATAAAVGIT